MTKTLSKFTFVALALAAVQCTLAAEQASGLAPAGASAPAVSPPASAPLVATSPEPRAVMRVNAGGSRRFVYRAVGKPLSELLQDFAASQGLAANVAPGVSGVVHANFDTTPAQFLDAILRSYSVISYNDGTALYFYPAKSVQTKLFRLKGYSRAQVQDLLRTLQIGDARYPLKYDQAHSTLMASGPPRHIELVTSAIESLDLGAIEGNERTVRVFPLRFASAADRRYGDSIIAGVASVLKSLYAGTGSPDVASMAGPIRPGMAGGKLKAMQSLGAAKFVPDLQARQPEGGGAAANSGDGAQAARGVRSPVDFDDDSPSFEADEGTNSVLVNGRGHRMAEYEALIRKLDVQPDLVELEAMIIDVSTDSLETLGIDWSLRGSNGSISMTGPNNAPLDSTGRSLVSGNFNLTTMVSRAAIQFVARVNALQGDGKAKIVAKPKVLGVVNRAAVMKEKRVAAVRVAGNLEANLYQIEAGTLLQVTPQVIARDGSNQIKMSLYIEDGNFEAISVDSVPVVKRTEIRTEAHVRDGESLLIGGITIESETAGTNGVPLLSKIPLLGALFRNSDTRAQRSERLFLITPRLLPVGADLPQAVAPAPMPAPYAGTDPAQPAAAPANVPVAPPVNPNSAALQALGLQPGPNATVVPMSAGGRTNKP